MKPYRLPFKVSTMSKAQLADMLGAVAMRDRRLKVAPDRTDSNLDVDPATVALIAAAGIVVVEIIKSVTQVYLNRKKGQSEPKKPPSVEVTVLLALGGRQVAKVVDAGQIPQALPNLPNNPAEIRLIQLK